MQIQEVGREIIYIQPQPSLHTDRDGSSVKDGKQVILVHCNSPTVGYFVSNMSTSLSFVQSNPMTSTDPLLVCLFFSLFRHSRFVTVPGRSVKTKFAPKAAHTIPTSPVPDPKSTTVFPILHPKQFRRNIPSQPTNPLHPHPSQSSPKRT